MKRPRFDFPYDFSAIGDNDFNIHAPTLSLSVHAPAETTGRQGCVLTGLDESCGRKSYTSSGPSKISLACILLTCYLEIYGKGAIMRTVVEIYYVISVSIIFGAFLYAAIAFMRKAHSGEIFIIWYILSCFFVLFLGLGIIAETNKIGLTEVCGPYEATCKSIHRYLTNLDDELNLISAIAVLTVGPQFLTYFLSGLSGSASTPRFVWQVERFVLLSLVKFLAALGGIAFAEPVAKVVVGNQVHPFSWIGGVLFTSAAFVIAAFEILIRETLPAFLRQQKRLTRPFSKAHAFFTRHRADD
jgi:hypothetical protein